MRSTGSFKRALIAAGAAALLALAAMAITLAVGLARADRLLDRVSRSQTQLALVTRLEADLNAVPAAPPDRRTAALADLARSVVTYRRTIEAETPIVPKDALPAQAIEARQAAELATLIARGRAGDIDRFRVLARAIVTSERIEADDALAAMRTLRRTGTGTAILLPILVALAGMFAMLWMLANLLRPIGALRRGVAALAQGDTARVDTSGFSDFDDLAHGFNAMADRIAAASRHLEAQVAERTTALADRNERLAAIDANRRLFFAQVGHELRTPVTVMMGEAEVALRDVATPPDALRDALGHVVANGQFVQRRLEDLLALASAEDGRLMIASVPIDVAAVMRDVARQAGPFARSSGSEIALTGSAQALRLRGDASWLHQALLALIDNAVKHGGGGRIDLTLAREAGRATLTVADDGPGVSEADLPHLFDTHYRATDRRGGSGLGLAVARWVAEAHRGTIGAANRVGGGLAVRIDLPLAA